MIALELRRLSKVYGEGPTAVHALREVDLLVEAGALVAVMGPSGSGKSTLLTIAGSLEEPTSGEVSVGGSALSTMSRNARARLRRRSIEDVPSSVELRWRPGEHQAALRS